MEPFLGYTLLRQSVSEDGKSIEAYYRKGYRQFSVKVELVNGKPHGSSEAVDNSGRTVAEVELDHGRITCFTEYDGHNETRYVSSDGMQNGTFVENDMNGDVVCKGVIRGGRIITTITPCLDKRGFYDIYDPDSGELIAVASMDRKCEMKNGKCYEIEDGKVIRVSMYVNNEKKASLPLEPLKDDSDNELYQKQSIPFTALGRNPQSFNLSAAFGAASQSFDPYAAFAYEYGSAILGGAIALGIIAYKVFRHL